MKKIIAITAMAAAAAVTAVSAVEVNSQLRFNANVLQGGEGKEFGMLKNEEGSWGLFQLSVEGEKAGAFFNLTSNAEIYNHDRDQGFSFDGFNLWLQPIEQLRFDIGGSYWQNAIPYVMGGFSTISGSGVGGPYTVTGGWIQPRGFTTIIKPIDGLEMRVILNPGYETWYIQGSDDGVTFGDTHFRLTYGGDFGNIGFAVEYNGRAEAKVEGYAAHADDNWIAFAAGFSKNIDPISFSVAASADIVGSYFNHVKGGVDFQYAQDAFAVQVGVPVTYYDGYRALAADTNGTAETKDLLDIGAQVALKYTINDNWTPNISIRVNDFLAFSNSAEAIWFGPGIYGHPVENVTIDARVKTAIVTTEGAKTPISVDVPVSFYINF